MMFSFSWLLILAFAGGVISRWRGQNHAGLLTVYVFGNLYIVFAVLLSGIRYLSGWRTEKVVMDWITVVFCWKIQKALLITSWSWYSGMKKNGIWGGTLGTVLYHDHQWQKKIETTNQFSISPWLFQSTIWISTHSNWWVEKQEGII